ncbi:xanthine dehydrogenase family protein molybdopterin-binding subunit [Puniceibacterium sp. IMCC21224]|uniref:xanthine dehydrogenase family protein molybdopterin-binding subunit n=1 Tax=Puniceibacterium sp. IMCC21224 TaxID=1618204 RepID=UPI00064DF213|nr:molybdopterin cofactor-binding domain-containing protein [Puniceibacterium sp. IMCC21224]KMK67229.1 aerobic-type carbon monoxide dehydrogenase, large subunit CoxL/CutL-like protein [Puniceibacterium sp. IMCC21224]
MDSLGTLTRRSFLIGSVAVAGGVAFGTYVVKTPVRNPLLDTLADGEVAITPYVLIAADGITLITPRADSGQGAYSVQAALIAEELDIDPASATITPGLPGPAYYNGAVLAESVPFPAYDQSILAEAMRRFMAVPAKVLQLQITGGSSTVPDGFTRLRMAGAVARETLKEAAARRTGLPRDQLDTAEGHVILPTGDRIAYTDLAADAAGIEPIRDVELRPPERWKRLGKTAVRTDMVAKCTGTEVYGIDDSVDGMVYATVRANPGINGDVVSFDATDAEAMSGVLGVLPVPHGVAVVARNTWTAFRAADSVRIEWGPPPYPASSAEIFDALEAVLDNDQSFDHRRRDDGDVDAALARGDVIKANYRIPYLAHAPLEPMNALVHVTDDHCEIRTGTQIPLFIRARAAQITGLDQGKVLVHVLPMGGSFGHRLEMTHVEQALHIAVAMKGTPIKLVWSRNEDMTHDYPRPAAVARARGRVVDGRVETFDLSVGQSAMTPGWVRRLSGMSLPGPDTTITTGSWDQPFAIPNYRVTGYRAPDMVPVSSWRSVGASGNGFLHDCFLDELIHAAGADPLAERIRLCMDDTSRRVLEAVGEMSGWDGPGIGENRGRGVGFCLSFGVPVAQVVDVTMTARGIRIDKVHVAVDVGQVLDPVNLEAQVCGGVIFGLGHAMNCALTYDNHTPQQTNFHAYEGMRLYQTPEIDVRVLTNGTKIRGIGEPGVPPAAPALANAIFAATGQRIRELPLNKHVAFV